MAGEVIIRWTCMILLARAVNVEAFDSALKLSRQHRGCRMLRLSTALAGELTPVRVITSKLFLSHKHPKGRSHPECPERLELAWKRLEGDGSAIDW